MDAERLAIRIEREPLDGMDACQGRYTLAEHGDSIALRSAGYTVYVRIEEVQELADALYRYLGAIEADKERYAKAREWLGRKARGDEIPGFTDARIRVETADNSPPSKKPHRYAGWSEYREEERG